MNFTATENLFRARAKEWLKDHPERDDILLEDLTAALLEKNSKAANDPTLNGAA